MEFKRDPRFGRMIQAMVTRSTPTSNLDLEWAPAGRPTRARRCRRPYRQRDHRRESHGVLPPEARAVPRRGARRERPYPRHRERVGDNCTADTVYFAQDAAKQGVDGFMCVVPYYNKPPQEGLYRHFKTICGFHGHAHHPVQHPRALLYQHGGRHHPALGPQLRQRRGHQGGLGQLRADQVHHRQRSGRFRRVLATTRPPSTSWSWAAWASSPPSATSRPIA